MDSPTRTCPICEAQGLIGPPCSQIESDPSWLKQLRHEAEQRQRKETEELHGAENVRHFTGGSAVNGQGVFLYGLIRRPNL